MGKEQTCDAVINGVAARGVAMLETDEILFRGSPRLKLPLKDIKGVQADGDRLELRHKGGTAVFLLGAKQAAAGAKRILEPPGLLDKLGVREGCTVTVAGNLDDDFVHSLELRGATVRRGKKGKDAVLVLFGADSVAELKAMSGLDKLIHPAGGIWIVYPKGRKDIREADVMAAGRDAGWKDNKTCRFSDTHTGLRFVIAVADRGAERSRSPARRPAAAKGARGRSVARS
ncbi:MAG: hypothetical protein FJX64_06870 [Alphaproteobacteria bacterium]|nr:hypothetical protein [Alphaproteobacteria bacterium]